MNKKNEVAMHINEKFNAFAKERNISMSETPRFCDVKIFASNKKTSQHMAVSATRDNVDGYIINVADKNLTFFSKKEAHCRPLANGEKVIGKNCVVSQDATGIYFHQ